MKKTEELHSFEIFQGPWQEINIDIIRPLPRSNDKNTIVVIVDQLTNIIRLKTTTIAVSLEKISKIYRNNI